MDLFFYVMSNKFSVFIFTAILTTHMLHAQQGWFLNQRTIIPYGGVAYQQIYLRGDLVKVQEIGYTLILNVSNHEMNFILPGYKTYWEGTFEEFRQGYSSLTLDQINEAVKMVPEKERELYKEFLLDMSNLALEEEIISPPGNIRIGKTAETVRICGYRTEKYQVFSDDELVEEVFIAPALSLGLGYKMSTLHEYLRKIALPFITNSYFFSKEYLALLNTGYPMKHIRYNRYVSEITEITEVKKFQQGNASFEPDTAYSKISFAELLLLQMRESLRED